MSQQQSESISREDALEFLIEYLRCGKKGPYGNYGYGLFLRNVLHCYAKEVLHLNDHSTAEPAVERAAPAFFDAAWELARRGILRPGVVGLRCQITDEGSGGAGFTVTAAGRRWLDEHGHSSVTPIDPTRFSQHLASFDPKMGEGYAERSQEAVRCYAAHAFLACCVMSGAAAESIMLSLAIARLGDAAKVEKDYLGGGGRQKVEKHLLVDQRPSLVDNFHTYTTLLKYWRDNAAHGHRLGLNETEAYTSLLLLLRFANFATDHWDELTK